MTLHSYTPISLILKTLPCLLLASIPLTGNQKALAANGKEGSFTVKPVNVNMSSITFERRKTSAHINGHRTNAFRSGFGLAANRPAQNGSGYDLELGYYLKSYLELFTIVGFSNERPIKKMLIRDLNVPMSNLLMNFKRRYSFGMTMGFRYYWETTSKWLPFVGAGVGVIILNKTKADVYDSSTFLPTPPFQSLGKATLQRRKTLFDGRLMGGVDYQFSETFSLTLATGLQYHPRSKKTTSHTGGRKITYRDNWNKLSIPFMVSLKITL